MTSHTDFPALILGNYPFLAHEANGGRVKHASGYDIRFEAAGSKLAHEVERWNPVTGELIAWVRVPVLNGALGASDTVIDLFYGKDVSTPEADPSGTWPAEYLLVHHHEQSPTSTVLDSTSYGRHGTPSDFAAGDLVSGKIGNCFRFRNAPFYSFPAPLSGAVTWTISVWVKRNRTGVGETVVGGGSPGTRQGLQGGYNSSNQAMLAFYADDLVVSDTFGAGIWHLVSYRFTPNTQSLLVDGVVLGTRSTGGTLNAGSTFYAGKTNWGAPYNAPLDGWLDNLVIRNVVVPAERLLAEFQNQNAPGSVWSIGAEMTP